MDVFLLRSGNPHQRSTDSNIWLLRQRRSTNHFQNASGLIHCGTPLGFVIFCPFLPSVRNATLGFGVELLGSSFQCGLL